MAKSTKDFTIKIGDDKPKVSLRRSALTDDETINQAVEKVATNKSPTNKAPTRPKTTNTAGKAKSSTKTTASARSPEEDAVMERLLSNKRLTIDIPFYLHDALREHNFRNRSTTKEIINDYLHTLLKVKDIRTKK